MKTFGIDISKWQKGINFSKVKAEGAMFVIIRGICGNVKDVEFESHYKNAKANGLCVGVYGYTKAKNEAEAREEAQILCDTVLKGKQFELPIYCDIEDAIQKGLTKAQNTAIVKAYCSTIEKNGYFAGVYSSKSFFGDYLNDNELQMYAHWVAQWTKSCTYGGKANVFGMWQFGGETNAIRTNKVAGVTCDQNYMLIDYPTTIKKAGLNGYVKAVAKPVATTPVAKPVAKTYTVKSGDTLSGIAKKQGTTINSLVSKNKAKYPSLATNKNLIKVGWVLSI